MERTSGIICNSLRALLRHFIQHLVKRDLFCFAFVVGECSEKSICWLICQTLDCVSGISAVSWSGEKLSHSVDGNQAGGDCLCTILNVDWKTMEAKGTGRAPLSQIDS